MRRVNPVKLVLDGDIYDAAFLRDEVPRLHGLQVALTVLSDARRAKAFPREGLRG